MPLYSCCSNLRLVASQISVVYFFLTAFAYYTVLKRFGSFWYGPWPLVPHHHFLPGPTGWAEFIAVQIWSIWTLGKPCHLTAGAGSNDRMFWYWGHRMKLMKPSETIDMVAVKTPASCNKSRVTYHFRHFAATFVGRTQH